MNVAVTDIVYESGSVTEAPSINTLITTRMIGFRFILPPRLNRQWAFRVCRNTLKSPPDCPQNTNRYRLLIAMYSTQNRIAATLFDSYYGKSWAFHVYLSLIGFDVASHIAVW